jgi:hypothetical protein
MALYSLGPFQFISLCRVEDPSAPPPIPQQQLELIQRRGVNGTGFAQTGVRANQFQMLSKVDAVDFPSAVNQAYQYQAAAGNQPLSIVWADQSFDAFNVQYVVLMAEPRKVRQLATAVGGLNPPSGAWLECLWTLIPVFTDGDPPSP